MLTVERPNTRQVLLPAKVLAIDLAEVGDVEGVLITRLAELMVNGFHAAVQSLADQDFGINGSMIMILKWLHEVGRLQYIMIDMVGVALDSCCCHNHIPCLSKLKEG